jgi:hypothetical protein
MGMKFRVLRGNHSEGKYPEGHPWVGRSIIYEIGEIVDSRSNLARHNKPGPLGPKFQRIYDNTPPTDKVKQGSEIARRREEKDLADDGNGPHGAQPQLPPDGLDEMTLPELKKLAKEEGIVYPQGASQAEIITLIRRATVTV